MNPENPAPAKDVIPFAILSISVIITLSVHPLSPPPVVLQAGRLVVHPVMDEKTWRDLAKYDAGIADTLAPEALAKLAGDLVELSKTDAGAKKVIANLAREGITFKIPVPTPTP